MTAPSDTFLKEVIDFTASWVAREGYAFEKALVEQETTSPLFTFLHETSSEDHNYYRSQVISCALKNVSPSGVKLSGRDTSLDGISSRGKALTIETPVASVSASPPVKHDKTETETDVEQFRQLVESMTPERESVARVVTHVFDGDPRSMRAMVEALLTQFFSGQQASESSALLMAKLYLISDILHNSFKTSSGSDAKLWQLFQDKLPSIFRGMNGHLSQVTSRIEREALRQRVLKVLNAWRVNYVFPAPFIDQLQALWIGKPNRV